MREGNGERNLIPYAVPWNKVNSGTHLLRLNIMICGCNWTMHIYKLRRAGGELPWKYNQCHSCSALQMAHVSWLIFQKKQRRPGIKEKGLWMFAARHVWDCRDGLIGKCRKSWVLCGQREARSTSGTELCSFHVLLNSLSSHLLMADLQGCLQVT